MIWALHGVRVTIQIPKSILLITGILSDSVAGDLPRSLTDLRTGRNCAGIVPFVALKRRTGMDVVVIRSVFGVNSNWQRIRCLGV